MHLELTTNLWKLAVHFSRNQLISIESLRKQKDLCKRRRLEELI